MKELWRRLWFFLHRAQFERDLEEEMSHHLALRAEERGSIDAARRQFGNVTSLRERSRAMWTIAFWEQFVQDIRYGLRTMAANPLFTAVTVLLLALGIGANTAIFSFMDAVMMRALPVQRPEELVVINWRAKDFPEIAHSYSGSSYKDARFGQIGGNIPFPAFEHLRANGSALSSLFAFAGMGRVLVEAGGQAEMASGEIVSGNFYSGLGVNPALGRLINEDDDRTGASVAVISHAWWRRRFAADPNVVGQSVLVNNAPVTIIGVSPAEFYGVRPGGAPEIFLPIHSAALYTSYPTANPRFIDPNFYWVEAMGRVKPGISIGQAQTALAMPFRLFIASTATKEKERADLPELILLEGGSGLESLRRQYSKPLFILMTMVGLILLIACANTANLLLARATARRREMALRLSLGASRARVVRQLLTESVMLAGFGALLGVWIGSFGIRFITWLLANGRDNFTLHAGLNGTVLGFTVLLALLTGILFGLVPALQATKVDLTPALKETRSSGSRTTRFGLSNALVVAQIAISLLLVIGAGLFVRTLANLQSVELGFNREHVLLFSLMGKQSGYKDAALVGLYEDLRNRFQTIPGVRGVSLSDHALVGGGFSSFGIKIPGRAVEQGRGKGTSVLNVGPSFFTTMQLPIVLGREIGERDIASPAVAVVNEVFAKKHFGSENPLGRRLGVEVNGGKYADIEIIGVAKAARYSSLKGEIPAIVYRPYTNALELLNQVVFELRTTGDPLTAVHAVRRIVHEVSPRVPLFNVKTQAAQIDQTIGQERTFADLCACFAALALIIASVGLYGTMAYAVERRTSEIGIRMALGAERRRIVWMVLRQVLALAAGGLAIGLAAAWATSRFVDAFLFGVKPNDPIAIAVSVLVLIAAALAAGYAPAWKASRIDPMVALRHE
jgi:macrolide transport system ATP-binding/permease protein